MKIGINEKRLKSGESIQLNDPEYITIQKVVDRTIRLSVQLNTDSNIEDIRKYLGEIIGVVIDDSTTIFAPFYTNFGKFIQIGENVFINHACSFLDMGGLPLRMKCSLVQR